MENVVKVPLPDRFMLEFGCGNHTAQGWIGMDKQDLPSVHIVWDIEHPPYPIPSECVEYIRATHILEHICPRNIWNVMNELHRIMLVGCVLEIAVPYAGGHADWWSPDHCGHFLPESFECFDPRYEVYKCYRPKPWWYMRDKTLADPNSSIKVYLKKEVLNDT